MKSVECTYPNCNNCVKNNKNNNDRVELSKQDVVSLFNTLNLLYVTISVKSSANDIERKHIQKAYDEALKLLDNARV